MDNEWTSVDEALQELAHDIEDFQRELDCLRREIEDAITRFNDYAETRVQIIKFIKNNT